MDTKTVITINGVILNEAQNETLVEALSLMKENIVTSENESDQLKVIDINYMEQALDPNVKKRYIR
jgi:hypothetical protein